VDAALAADVAASDALVVAVVAEVAALVALVEADDAEVVAELAEELALLAELSASPALFVAITACSVTASTIPSSVEFPVPPTPLNIPMKIPLNKGRKKNGDFLRSPRLLLAVYGKYEPRVGT
jgi:hypothetical protein